MVAVISFFIITIAITPIVAAASVSSEAEALLQSGWSWWRGYTYSTSHHCTWLGVVCDDAGSVVAISPPSSSANMYQRNEIKNMNFSCFPNLVRLQLHGAGLIGNIPPQIFGISKLKYLDLSSNFLSGQLPSFVSRRRSQLEEVDISGNYFLNGSIPSNMGNLKKLVVLRISGNQLRGPIPGEICNLKNLVKLDLSYNRIHGTIPQHIGDLKKLEWLDLKSNHLTGSITPSLGKCSNLQALDLSHNTLREDIPFEQLSNLKQLRNVDFSYNNLSGSIPFYMPAPFNVFLHCNSSKDVRNGYDLLSSTPFEGNTDLRGNYSICPHTSSSKRNFNAITLLVPIIILLWFLFIGYLFLSQRKVKKTQVEATSNDNGDLFSVWNYDGQIAYQDIIRATEDFDIRYCIGTGGYGSVYKAKLPSGRIVALKKLHRLEAEEPTFDRSFRNEVRLLTEISHKNIVKLHGFCLHNRCMFLVYEYMERGSLFCALRNDEEWHWAGNKE